MISEEVKSYIETAHKALCVAYNKATQQGCSGSEVENLSHLCDELSGLY